MRSSHTPNAGRPAAGPVAASVLSLVLFGCASSSYDRDWVSDALRERTGHRIRTADSEAVEGEHEDVGEGVLDEDAAVALAMWNNAAFRADMARLTAATADFKEAQRIENPSVSALGPIGVIDAAVSIVASISSLIQRPQRTRAAARALESVAESLVQTGLDLARDVRVAHTNLVLAERRTELLQRLAETANSLARMADILTEAGEVGPADALAVRANASVAVDAVAVAQRELTTATATLQVLLGREAGGELRVESKRTLPPKAPPLGDLLQVARLARPDVRAAELELEGAAARAGWERSRVLNLAFQSDIQWNANEGGARFGAVVELPIFNQNQGGIGRAEAAIEAAWHRIDAVRQQVTAEVVSAAAQLDQSLASLERYQREILPPLEGTLEAATYLYELGDESYIVVLDALRQLTSAEVRTVELEADVRRSHAELERAVGARLEMRSTATGARS